MSRLYERFLSGIKEQGVSNLSYHDFTDKLGISALVSNMRETSGFFYLTARTENKLHKIERALKQAKLRYREDEEEKLTIMLPKAEVMLFFKRR